MADYNDIKSICDSYNVEIREIPFVKNVLSYEDQVLEISQDWIKAADIADDFFEILYNIEMSRFCSFEGDDQVIYAVETAIDVAKEYGVKISLEKQNEMNERVESEDFWFDFSEIDDRTSMIELIDEYGLPLKIRLPYFFGDFYFLAQELDYTNKKVIGEQYKDGSLYKHCKYSFYDYCSLYENDISDELIEEELDEEGAGDRDYNNEIKQRIKDKDAFDEVAVNNEELLNHQKAGCLLASKYDKFAFFYDTGTGKTVMTLSIIKQKQIEEDAHFLILAPKAIIKTAWLEDSKNFFPDLRIFPLSNNISFEDFYSIYKTWEEEDSEGFIYIPQPDWDDAFEEVNYESEDWEEQYDNVMHVREEIKDTMIEMADHYIVNIEKFRYDPAAIMENYWINGLVVDESAILKNPDSVSAKTLSEYADEFDYIYLLSGKPAPNNSTEYYAQMRLVDPNTFNMSFATFKGTYFEGSGSKTHPISTRAEKAVADMIAVRSLIVSKEDCLNLPDIHHEIRIFKLPTEISRQYDRLYEDCIFELKAREKNKKGAYYSSVCMLAIFTKLREIASGFLIDEYGDVSIFHDEKDMQLEIIVKENPDDQIIVWCQFEQEILKAKKVLSKYGNVVTAYGKTKNIDESIKAFKSGDAKYIIAHPKSIKYGVTFVKCHIAVYYAMSYSAEDYYQSRDRIHRLGQTRECYYYYIQAEDTIDEIMYDAVKNKMSYAEVFARIIKDAAKHGIDYSSFKLEKEPEKDELLSTQNVIQKYNFSMVDDTVYTYKYNNETRSGSLYNTLLKDKKQLRPEEVLFEIGYSIKKEQVETSFERYFNQIICEDIKDTCYWVIKQMKALKIKRIARVYDYLEEQIQKQYEIDVANGIDSFFKIDDLSLKR